MAWIMTFVIISHLAGYGDINTTLRAPSLIFNPLS